MNNFQGYSNPDHFGNQDGSSGIVSPMASPENFTNNSAMVETEKISETPSRSEQISPAKEMAPKEISNIPVEMPVVNPVLQPEEVQQISNKNIGSVNPKVLEKTIEENPANTISAANSLINEINQFSE